MPLQLVIVDGGERFLLYQGKRDPTLLLGIPVDDVERADERAVRRVAMRLAAGTRLHSGGILASSEEIRRVQLPQFQLGAGLGVRESVAVYPDLERGRSIVLQRDGTAHAVYAGKDVAGLATWPYASPAALSEVAYAEGLPRFGLVVLVAPPKAWLQDARAGDGSLGEPALDLGQCDEVGVSACQRYLSVRDAESGAVTIWDVVRREPTWSHVPKVDGGRSALPLGPHTLVVGTDDGRLLLTSPNHQLAIPTLLRVVDRLLSLSPSSLCAMDEDSAELQTFSISIETLSVHSHSLVACFQTDTT